MKNEKVPAFCPLAKKYTRLSLMTKNSSGITNLLFDDVLRDTVELRFNEVAGDRPNLFVKWRVRYIENLDITNLRGNDQNVRYIVVIVND